MGAKIDKLLHAAGPALSTEKPFLDTHLMTMAGSLGHELVAMLHARNGFYAFESALHVLPAASSPSPQNLENWNRPDTWRISYGDQTEGLLFWAEDVFGCQFALNDGGVYRFDPETGEHEWLTPTLEAWSDMLLSNYKVETGYTVAHEWQLKHGALVSGHRLIPKQPFVLGGQFDADNLYALDAVKGMLFRAEIARQIRELPDGSSVELVVVDGDDP
jgi:hypothetical protein